ncbi:sulfite exporter TauE/SafE family protein [Noviherbaspirillum saxi]|uniref:Sulfite exporter TauE/SafE family protein n=1 Tax=Noviherbaspirillum saxi TaxID=2320863 RepID=A0A3A3FRP7_9BURK|nr:sulfite exporter TauE/SafE family protein [Noviherbaspirillum saxi]RJF96122.1 sulfite exporter TauE/SafE family protein [Noviherbaspirillum saxi]
MSDLSFVSFFLVGLLGSVHCIGMCGGIVSALSVAPGPERRRVVPVIALQRTAMTRAGDIRDAARVVAYNAGRLASYALAGAIVGAIAGGVQALSFMSSLQIILYWLANLMLVALGLYLMDAWHGLTRVEALGRHVWRRIQPFTKSLLPMDSLGKAFALGTLWGWVPCGMVYSMLAGAMLAGSALDGAKLMLAFGIGTLPALLTIGVFGSRLRRLVQDRRVRIAGGVVVLLFGLLGMYRSANGVPAAWTDVFCMTPSAGHGVNTGQ